MRSKGAALQVRKGGKVVERGAASDDGHFQFILHVAGEVIIKVEVPGFQAVVRTVRVEESGNAEIVITVTQLAFRVETVTVTGAPLGSPLHLGDCGDRLGFEPF